ncbi:sulfotransferase [Nocardioides sp.]|uniref:sulfotransferase family protein n=1 Tax=Nocardioides sp. TaxID=35761 RepID=UPI00286D6DF8|nr:sulfotransferase [Nocardioides sp.]
MSARVRDDVGSLEDITAAAVRSTGLTDFGDHGHEEGLTVLLEDYASASGLTGIGNYRMRGMVKGLLVAKLMARQGFLAHPASTDVAIEKPVFIMGLPRSGTTVLQRLLTADPGHQGLEQWLADLPQPRPPRDTWVDDPVFSAMQGGYAAFHDANPELAGLHYSDAASHEECWRLLQHTGRSVAFETQGYTPGYSEWLRGQDWMPAYERHRALLQLIGLGDADQRWILKNPSHLVALDAIRTVYPDAVIVVTHRDVVACTASMCSLAAASTRGCSDVFVGDTIGRTQLDLLVREQAAFRSSPHSQHVIDVAYDDLVGDPVSAVHGVYAAAGFDWSDAVAEAVSAELERSRSGVRAPRHAYDLADYGLTESQVRDALSE